MVIKTISGLSRQTFLYFGRLQSSAPRKAASVSPPGIPKKEHNVSPAVAMSRVARTTVHSAMNSNARKDSRD